MEASLGNQNRTIWNLRAVCVKGHIKVSLELGLLMGSEIETLQVDIKRSSYAFHVYESMRVTQRLERLALARANEHLLCNCLGGSIEA